MLLANKNKGRKNLQKENEKIKKLEEKLKFTANYSYTNNNFVIQNLIGERIQDEYLPAICILKNILCRGKPTLMSKYLQEEIGDIQNREDYKKQFALIDSQIPVWYNTIKGDQLHNNFPAKDFFENVLPNLIVHLSPGYSFITQLLLPEAEINEITQIENEEFKNQKVDFYLPQAYLVIEIDGWHHQEINVYNDAIRDGYLKSKGVTTVRITTQELRDRGESYSIKIKSIIDRLNEYRENLEPYKLAYFENYENIPEINIKGKLLPTAIMRFQILILQLLEFGIISLKDNEWNFALFEYDVRNFANIAINDLFIWFNNIFRLQKIQFKPPIINIRNNSSTNEYTFSEDQINIDFSLLKRWTDENQLHPKILYVRTDYLDKYRYYVHYNNKYTYKWEKVFNNLKVTTYQPFNYKVSIVDENDISAMKFFLDNIFGYKEFLDGQLPIILNALNRNDTIGLLPTGGGKSLCYQLATLLQPCLSFVVCPIKSLMYDQIFELQNIYINNINCITSDQEADEKNEIIEDFAKGKYLFILISPERFQSKKFREAFALVNKDFHISYAVIDEVHCLSEWGHDFRTSYLNLAKTIRKYCNNFNFLGLTATASVNVLRDIQIEFNIKQENVRTLIDFTREEIEFEVFEQRDRKLKYKTLLSKLRNISNEIDLFEYENGFLKSGIIFTPNKNGEYGCRDISIKLINDIIKDPEQLQLDFNKEKFNYDNIELLKDSIKYFSGEKPKYERMNLREFEEYKRKVQEDFKFNRFPLLAATKAFGMGINKQNIYFTLHYGIPSSMEALYQEGGRAGRDRSIFKKSHAKCYVLLTPEQIELDSLWDINSNYETIKQISDRIGYNGNDIFKQIFLFLNSNDSIDNEYHLIYDIFIKYGKLASKGVKVKAGELKSTKGKIERAIYRLSNLKIIDDWTIDYWDKNSAVFNVDFLEFKENDLINSLITFIQKYDYEFTLDNILNISFKNYFVYRNIWLNKEYSIFEKVVRILLQWSYDNFANNRRQSLKDVYELCLAFVNNKIDKIELKKRLEDYFKFTETTIVLQNIADNPTANYLYWFTVFYSENDLFLELDKIIELQSNLSRFLESYTFNSGLNLLSGLIRLLVNDYSNPDGKIRLENSLNQLNNYDNVIQLNIFENILTIGLHLDLENKNNLSESLISIPFPNALKEYDRIFKIFKYLEDTYSIKYLLEKIIIPKLIKVKEKFYARLK